MGKYFHGTDADFTTFRSRQITWFTPDKNEALIQYRADDSIPWFVFEAELSVSNPADIDDKQVGEILEAAGFEVDQIGAITDGSPEIIRLLEAHGFDGLTAQMGEVRHVAVFDSAQVIVRSRVMIPPPAK